MSWYKKALDMSDLEDRNIVNETISFFKDLDESLYGLSKFVFQNAKIARKANRELIDHKKLSSYPLIVEILREADIHALDSPWKFAELCKEASEEVNIRIRKLEREREKFTEEGLPKRMKGWVDIHG